MQQPVARAADADPRVRDIAGANMRYDRDNIDLGEAVTLRVYLDQHPDQAPFATSWTHAAGLRPDQLPRAGRAGGAAGALVGYAR